MKGVELALRSASQKPCCNLDSASSWEFCSTIDNGRNRSSRRSDFVVTVKLHLGKRAAGFSIRNICRAEVSFRGDLKSLVSG
jgi:hypothetical protein